jgi:hypothetical protein
MGFFDTLRRVLPGELHPPAPSQEDDEPVLETRVAAGDAGVYDRVQWRKKLQHVLDNLPGSRSQWPDLITESRALGFEHDWTHQCQIDAFALMVRHAVADRQFTEDEHRKLDLARDLIGLPDAEAEAILHGVIAEAESFFGKPVEES